MEMHATRKRERVVLVIIDGVGDITIPAFGDRTPLQVAHTPNLDAIAAAGVNGLMDAVEPGLACGSDTSHMNLLGYDPRVFYRGRGAFESMGAGLHMEPGDIAFKSNFATLNPSTGIVEKRRADRQFDHLGPSLCAALDGAVLPSFPQHSVAVRYATEHRCGVVVRGPGLSDSISGTDPLKDNLPLLQARPLDESPEAAHTAAVVNELSDVIRGLLEEHPINVQRRAQGLNPANVVLLRGCGSRIQVPGFSELHGMRACLVAPTKIIAGLGASFGITPVDAPGATGSYDSDFGSKAAVISAALGAGQAAGQAALALPYPAAAAAAPGSASSSVEPGQQQEVQPAESASRSGCAELASCGGCAESSAAGAVYDFGLLHVKAVDDTGHDRMLGMRVRFLEAVDTMIGQLLYQLAQAEAGGGASYSLCVTGDHSTPVVFGDHSHEPVPMALAHVRDVVRAMGGPQQLALRAPPAQGAGGGGGGLRVPLPDVKAPPPALEELVAQAAAVQARRGAAAAGLRFGSGTAAASAALGGGGAAGGDQGAGTEALRLGSWPEAWPQATCWDGVASFDELSAARGCLGRFPACELMGLVKRFAGWGP